MMRVVANNGDRTERKKCCDWWDTVSVIWEHQ